MRVMVAHSRYRLAGGEERNIELLCRGLLDRGVDVRRFELSASNIDSLTRRLRAGAGMVYRPSAGRALRAQTTAWKPDVVHVHNLLPMLSPSVLRAAKGMGAGVVLTAHNYRLLCPAGTLIRHGRQHTDCVRGSSFLCGARGARDSYAESLVYGAAIEVHRRLRLVDRWVDRYITPSACVRDVLVQSGSVRRPEDRIRVIPNGVPLPPRPTNHRRYALYAGRLSTEKGITTLLSAATQAPEVPLVIAGDGPLRGEVSCAPGVRYLGALLEAELEQVRSDAAFTVFPSECPDVQPFSALESLAAGVPILAARVGGLAELTCDSDSRVVEAGDGRALAEAMRGAWQAAGATPAWGDDARRVAASRFTLEAHIASVVALYDSLVG